MTTYTGELSQGGTVIGTAPVDVSAPATAVPLGIAGSWTLRFEDTFSGSSLDTSKWTPNWLGGPTSITNNIATDSLNCYDPARVSVSGGNLRLDAIAMSQSCGGQRQYSSGCVTTAGKYETNYGVFEARILMPTNGSGQVVNWPAFWTNGHHSPSWPQAGEVDIAECLGGKVTCNFHTSSANTGNVPAGQYGGAFHTFSVNRQPSFVRWYFDGVQVFSQTFSSGSLAFNHYIILNQEIAPAHGGPTAVPTTMLVDYVRHWSGS